MDKKTKKIILIPFFAGIIYGSISYLGMLLYGFIPVLNVIFFIPSLAIYSIANFFKIPISSDLGQTWNFYDWFVVASMTAIVSSIISYLFYIIKKKFGKKLFFKIIFWFFIICIGIFCVIFFAFSYDTDIAHPLLTKKAIEKFNETSENKISEKEINWIIQGAKEEDTPVRWMNHFYDPVNNKGLYGFQTAKDWSKANIKQSLYSKGNRTWQKAIESYQKNKKQEAFIALGHVLHLIEDMAVPAHTRADAHNPDPYEEWVKNNSEQKFDTIDIFKLDNLDNYFDVLANYSNKFFFSKDTIDKYPDPKLDGTLIEMYNLRNFEYGYKLINNKKVKIVKIIRPLAFLPKSKIEYVIDDPAIHQSYYSLLAPRAVSTSAGVIELFFKEVKKEVKEETKTEQTAKETSWWGSVKSVLSGAVNMVKDVFMGTRGEVRNDLDISSDNSLAKEENKEENKENIVNSSSAPEKTEITPVWDAELVEQNKIESIKAGETAELFVKYKNSGNQNFTKDNVSLNIYSFNTTDFYHPSWITEKRPALISSEKVEPSQIAEFRFKIKAPKETGNYTIAFIPVYQIDHNFKWLGDDVARWQFEVVGDENVATKSDLAQDIDDVNETQEHENIKTQEQKIIETQKRENTEASSSADSGQTLIRGVEGFKESAKTNSFARAIGDGTPPEKIILIFPNNPFYLTNQSHLILEGQKAGDVAQININLNNNEEIALKNFIDENNWSYEVKLVEGANKITFIARDSSKNLSEPVALDVILDTAAPAAPVVAANNGDDFTTGWPVAFLSGTKESDAYFVFLNNGEAEIIDENNWQIELNLNEGENLFQIFAKDLAGNSSEVVNLKIIRDSSLLIINLTGKPLALTNQTSANFVFNAGVDVEQFYCSLNSEEETKCASPFLVENLSQGWQKFNLRASSEEISPIHYQWFIDLIPPSDSELILNNGDEWTNQPEINLVISLSNDAAFWLITEGSATPEINSPNWRNTEEKIFSMNFELSDSDGKKIIYLWTMDEAGNINSNAASQNITLDRIAPTCEVAQLNSEQQTENFNLTINATDNFEVKDWIVEYQIDGGEWQVLVNGSMDNVIEFIGEDGKSYGFRCEAADMANNANAAKDVADAATIIDASSNPDVIINELMWMGSSLSSADEFIELKNTANKEIDLSGWQITKFSGNREVLMLTIEDKIIPANGYFLIAHYNWDNIKSILNVEPDLVDTGVSLVNTKLRIKLYDGDWANGANLIDMADDGVGVPLSGTLDSGKKIYRSMERNNIFGVGTEKESWHTCSQAVNLDEGAVECGTPKAQNSISLSESATIIDRNIIADTTWHAYNNPYVLTKEITVDIAKLTIEAGVVVKFMPGVKLILRGTVSAGSIYQLKEAKTAVAQDFFTADKESKTLFSMMRIPYFSYLEVFGQESNEVIFTSIYDDSRGGNTVNNGSDILPQAGDWGGIFLNDCISANLENVIIYYGESIVVNHSKLIMSNVEMKNNNGGVRVLVRGAIVNISDSYLDNFNYNIDNSFNGDFIIDPLQNYFYGFARRVEA